MRKMHAPVLALAALLAACGGSDSPAFNVAVFGDMPYGTSPTDTTEFKLFPNVMASINADTSVSQALFDGDIHSGKEYCTQAYDQSILAQFNTLRVPLVYTPGDNEWADCHKAGEGGGSWNATAGTVTYVVDANGAPVDYARGNPVDNLALVRQLFFPKPGMTLGASPVAVHTQAQEYDPAHPSDAHYVENTWYATAGIHFVATNIPGGSNNGTDIWYGAPTMSQQQMDEVAERSGATLRWLQAAFVRATQANASALVLVVQADMWDLDGKSASHIANYKPYIDAIAAGAKAFGKPVLLFNGDSHVFRSDNPLVQGAPCVSEPSPGATAVACTDDAYANQPNGYNVPNFHRVVTHGSTQPLEWLKLAVDPAQNASTSAYAFGPFAWTRVKAQ